MFVGPKHGLSTMYIVKRWCVHWQDQVWILVPGSVSWKQEENLARKWVGTAITDIFSCWSSLEIPKRWVESVTTEISTVAGQEVWSFRLWVCQTDLVQLLNKGIIFFFLNEKEMMITQLCWCSNCQKVSPKLLLSSPSVRQRHYINNICFGYGILRSRYN